MGQESFSQGRRRPDRYQCVGAGHDAYPSRPVKLIVGYAAGGARDVIARLVAQQFTVILGRQFTVENRPGANGNLGADVVQSGKLRALGVTTPRRSQLLPNLATRLQRAAFSTTGDRTCLNITSKRLTGLWRVRSGQVRQAPRAPKEEANRRQLRRPIPICLCAPCQSNFR
jgi:hypothetical protein